LKDGIDLRRALLGPPNCGIDGAQAGERDGANGGRWWNGGIRGKLRGEVLLHCFFHALQDVYPSTGEGGIFSHLYLAHKISRSHVMPIAAGTDALARRGRFCTPSFTSGLAPPLTLLFPGSRGIGIGPP